MRIFALLNRRYTPAQSVALLVSSVAMILAAPIALGAAGVPQSLAAPVALVLALAVFFAGAAVIDRRQARRT